MLQHQNRVITRPIQIPATITATRHAHKAMQEIVASVRIRFDVVEKDPRCLDQFGQGRACVRRVTRLSRWALACRTKPRASPCWSANRSVRDANQSGSAPADPPDHGHRARSASPVASLRFRNYTEMALCRGLGTANPSPATERALAAVGSQGRRIRTLQVLGELAQGISELTLQPRREWNAITFERRRPPPPTTRVQGLVPSALILATGRSVLAAADAHG